MDYQAILDEVEHLHSVSTRLEGLAEYHPRATEELLTIAGNVRNVATLLAVLVATLAWQQVKFIRLVRFR